MAIGKASSRTRRTATAVGTILFLAPSLIEGFGQPSFATNVNVLEQTVLDNDLVTIGGGQNVLNTNNIGVIGNVFAADNTSVLQQENSDADLISNNPGLVSEVQNELNTNNFGAIFNVLTSDSSDNRTVQIAENNTAISFSGEGAIPSGFDRFNVNNIGVIVSTDGLTASLESVPFHRSLLQQENHDSHIWRTEPGGAVVANGQNFGFIYSDNVVAADGGSSEQTSASSQSVQTTIADLPEGIFLSNHNNAVAHSHRVVLSGADQGRATQESAVRQRIDCRSGNAELAYAVPSVDPDTGAPTMTQFDEFDLGFDFFLTEPLPLPPASCSNTAFVRNEAGIELGASGGSISQEALVLQRVKCASVKHPATRLPKDIGLDKATERALKKGLREPGDRQDVLPGSCTNIAMTVDHVAGDSAPAVVEQTEIVAQQVDCTSRNRMKIDMRIPDGLRDRFAVSEAVLPGPLVPFGIIPVDPNASNPVPGEAASAVGIGTCSNLAVVTAENPAPDPLDGLQAGASADIDQDAECDTKRIKLVESDEAATTQLCSSVAVVSGHSNAEIESRAECKSRTVKIRAEDINGLLDACSSRTLLLGDEDPTSLDMEIKVKCKFRRLKITADSLSGDVDVCSVQVEDLGGRPLTGEVKVKVRCEIRELDVDVDELEGALNICSAEAVRSLIGKSGLDLDLDMKCKIKDRDIDVDSLEPDGKLSICR